jgi:hypothetical protein
MSLPAKDFGRRGENEAHRSPPIQTPVGEKKSENRGIFSFP